MFDWFADLHWFKKLLVIGGIGIVVIAIVALATSSEDNEAEVEVATGTTPQSTDVPPDNEDNEAEVEVAIGTTPQSTDVAPDVVIGAAMLIAESEDNPIATERKYKGSYMTVTGFVDDISEDPFDSDAIVSIGSGAERQFKSVQCEVSGENVDQVLSLSQGDAITARGKFDGVGLFQEAELKDCQVSKR